MEFKNVHLNQYGYYELNKKPSLDDRKHEFEEEYYQNSMSSYAQEYTEDEKTYFKNKLEQKYMMVMNILGDNVNDLSMLDLGCGEGFALDFFSKKGFDVTGIDFSEYAVKHQNPDMLKNLICGDCNEILPELKNQGKKFDLINMDSSLDMMLNPEEIVEHFSGILKENGIVLIRVGNNYSVLQLKLLEDGKLKRDYWLDESGHPSYFNKDGMMHMMEAHGYRCVDFFGESFIDLNLTNDLTNYYENPQAGKSCYRSKVYLENLMHEISPEKTLEVFRILGDMGLGREIIGIFKRE